jgi:hypothetical protein
MHLKYLLAFSIKRKNDTESDLFSSTQENYTMPYPEMVSLSLLFPLNIKKMFALTGIYLSQILKKNIMLQNIP